MSLKFAQTLQLPALKEFLNTAKMLLDLSIPELIQLVYKSVKKITVMGHNYERSVIILECLLENILRPDVHMIGRLVKCQKIVRLEDELGHGKPGPFSSAQHGYLLIYIFSLEKERSENIAKLQPYITYSNTVQRTEHGIILIKDILLILSIITDIHIVSHLGFSGHRVQLVHDHTHKGGLSFSVPSHKSDLLSPSYLDLRIAEHNLLSITDLHVHCLIGNVARSWSRRKLHGKSRPVLYIDLYPLKLFQLLYTRLDLI